jgi:beta-N-acetylhexosaminidase
MLGLRDAGVMACAKHFPGHGNTTEDSHEVLPFQPDDRESLDQVELPPFREAISQGIELIMPAHVTYPALDPSGLPATVSKPVLTGLLRDELGFRGVIVTDDFNMQGIIANFTPGEAAVRAIEAGADMILCVRMEEFDGGDPHAIEKIRSALLDAVQSGRLSAERIDASFNRIVELKAKHRVGSPAAGRPGLACIRSGAHFRALARVLDEAANRREEAGQP